MVPTYEPGTSSHASVCRIVPVVEPYRAVVTIVHFDSGDVMLVWNVLRHVFVNSKQPRSSRLWGMTNHGENSTPRDQ